MHCAAETSVSGPASARRKPRVALVDDDVDTHEVLRLLLAAEFDLISFVSSEDFLAFQAASRASDASRFDAVVVDLGLPGAPGTALIRALRSSKCPSKILAFTGHSDDSTVRAAAAAGELDAYIVKGTEEAYTIGEVLRRVLAGGCVLSTLVGRALLRDYAEGGRRAALLSRSTRPTLDKPLPPRTREVFVAVARNAQAKLPLTNRGLASTLRMSEHTLEYHLGLIFDAMRVKGLPSPRREAVEKAILWGVLAPDEIRGDTS